MVARQTGDILSYLTLRSEINGTVEHPERYFDTTNINRNRQMDMLLLTQGWRAYLWQRLADSIPHVTYDVEQGITLTGHVRKVFGNKPLPGMSITMFAPKAEGPKLFSAKTDVDGKFTIDSLIIYGYQFLNFTSRRADKINSDGNSKGHSAGWIQVDSLSQNKPAILPQIDLPGTTAYNTDSLMEHEKKRRKFTFSGNNELKTVQVKAPPHELRVEVHNIGPAEHKDYNSLMHYLLYMLPAAHEELGGCPRSSGGMDNAPLEPSPILCFSYNPVKKVNIIGRYSDNSK